jgi:adenylate cyclase class 2
MEHQEIEVRFLEINKEELIGRLNELGAKDLGEDLLEEIIIYDKDLKWREEGGQLMRLRTRQGKTTLTYKHHKEQSVNGTEEIEFEVSDPKKAEALLERLGFVGYRHQQKKRHTYELDEVVFDIDTWPRIPTYVELEGPSEAKLKEADAQLGLDWKNAVFDNPRIVIEERYSVPVGHMTWFTFDRFE